MTDSRRVLVVEDDPNENEFLSLTARGLGFAVESAFDGQQALELAGKNKPSLVLLDALLPKLDGFAVLTELRQRMPDVPVIMMSGIYKKRTYEAEALRQGAVAYLVKPLSVVPIWDLLERHLGTSSGTLPKDFPGVPFWRRPLPAVLGDLHIGKKTGLLFVRGNGGASILFFEDGTLVFARCNDTSTRLDRLLVQMGKVPAAMLPKMNELVQASKGIRLGELLVQEGILSEETVREALAEQQRLHLMRPFTWTEGACHFFPTDAPRRETFKVPVDVPGLVFWGCRNLPIDDALIRWLPSTARKPRLNAPMDELVPRLGLSPGECELLGLIDGTRSVGQLRSVARLLGVDAERVMAGLHALQLLDVPALPDKAGATGMAGANIPAAGDITKFPPALLLVTAALARKTGMVQLEATQPAGQARTLWFENGALAFASSNDPGDRLGQVLLKENLLTKEQLQQALAMSQERPGVALGRILVDLNLLGPDDLHRALVFQAQHAVNALIGWRSGTFQFHERDLPVKDIVPLGLDTRNVLMAAFRTCPFSDLAGKLPPPTTRLRRSGACHELAADLPLTALEDRMLLEVDGNLSVQDLAARATEGGEAVLRAVHALLSMGLLDGIAPAANAAPVPTPRPAPAAAAAPAGPSRMQSEEFGESGKIRLDEPMPAAAPRVVTPPPAAPVAAAPPAPPVAATPAKLEFAPAPEPASADFAGMSWDLPQPDTHPVDASFGDIPLDGGLEDMLLSGPPAEPVSAPPSSGASGTSASRSTASAVAVAPPPVAAQLATPAPTPMGQAQQIVQLSQFFELLSQWLDMNPGTVPESVLAVLPPDIRQMFKL